jgi:hypothetical protein
MGYWHPCSNLITSFFICFDRKWGNEVDVRETITSATEVVLLIKLGWKWGFEIPSLVGVDEAIPNNKVKGQRSKVNGQWNNEK